MLRVAKTAGVSTLHVVLSSILRREDMFNTLQLDPTKVRLFSQKVAESYFSNPYHDHKHATDVVQFVYFSLSTCHATKLL